VTPAQLRAYATVVRHGSVKDAGAELGVTEAAVSGHVAQLRKELGDQLFSRTGSGLAFTPGGLRLATRAAEMLGLQDQTVREVREAKAGRRVLRLAVSSLFAEYAAPGLIDLFSTRADDLAVELSVHPTDRFVALLDDRVADLAIGPQPKGLPASTVQTTFLKYQVVAVCGPGHPAALGRMTAESLRDQVWLLGPAATEADGVVSGLIAPTAPEADRWETIWHYMQGGPGVFKGDLFFYTADGDVRGRVAEIDTAKCPLYLLTGEYDYSCTPDDTRDLASRIKGAEAIVMAGLGHFPVSEDPARFLSYLRPVLDRIAGG